jgi:copper oxidase (laccase) domain-containing protein
MLIQAPALSSHSGIRHAFFTRQGGVSDGIYASLNGGIGSSDEPAKVQENRHRMAEALGVEPDALISVYQVHSPDAVIVEGPWRGERPKVDAMVTAMPGLALAITTADCGPVLFADAGARDWSRPCRLARRRDRRARIHPDGHGAARRPSRKDRRGTRPDDQPKGL